PSEILQGLAAGFKALYSHDAAAGDLALQPTRKEFSGTYTFVTFPYGKISKKSPEQTGDDLGRYLVENTNTISGYNVVKGFLNREINPSIWLSVLSGLMSD